MATSFTAIVSFAATNLDNLFVLMVPIANGADNIGVYIPVFSSYSPADFAVTLLVSASMLAVWCRFGYVLANSPLIRKLLLRYQHILVLISLGLLILSRSM